MSELYQKALQNLRNIWGYPDFRPGQNKAVASVLENDETLVLFPTGGGKSLCYQVPATVLSGLTIVISPLVALMQDQVEQAKKLGIPATLINSSISRKEVEQRLINARNGMYKLLYMAPERLQTELWQSELPNLSIDLVAVDEAHCISEWGHDFRPPYRLIRESFAQYQRPLRWLALTATATPEVRQDIIDVLKFTKPNIISRGFNRDNLRWWVIHEEQKEKKILDIVSKASGSGLIYASTRKACETLANNITEAGYHTEAYHAGLTPNQRNDIQERWINGSLPIVTATNAFGMGIDKPDCRYVIHFDVPYSMESYYQEAGRAGRDGKLSYPMLLYRKSDKIISEDRLAQSYPDTQTLSKIYSTLCDSWQLAINSEMPDFELIDFESIKKRSGFRLPIIKKAVNILEQLGILEIRTPYKEMLGIQFMGTMEGIRSQIQNYKKSAKAAFADTIHRIYGVPAHERIVDIEIDYILEKTKTTRNKLLKALQVFQGEQLLTYRHLEKDPLGRLTFERCKTIPLNVQSYQKHRENLFQKLDRMYLFLETKGCRSAYIRRYFGEADVPDECGNCDYCLNKQKIGKTQLSRKILQTIENGASHPDSIKQQVSCKTQELKDSLEYLVREGFVEVVRESETVAYKVLPKN